MTKEQYIAKIKDMSSKEAEQEILNVLNKEGKIENIFFDYLCASMFKEEFDEDELCELSVDDMINMVSININKNLIEEDGFIFEEK